MEPKTTLTLGGKSDGKKYELGKGDPDDTAAEEDKTQVVYLGEVLRTIVCSFKKAGSSEWIKQEVVIKDYKGQGLEGYVP